MNGGGTGAVCCSFFVISVLRNGISLILRINLLIIVVQKVDSFSKRGLQIMLPEESVIELKSDKLIVFKYIAYFIKHCSFVTYHSSS